MPENKKDKEDLFEELTAYIGRKFEDLSIEEYKNILDRLIDWCEMVKDAG